jgi:alkanesulfonate monooxygenase SsuD/methylene tetrahydromethanopterin reductase-like flavin-dependent oxidoreductase (luciferase family)
LNIPHSLQGRPVIIQAGASARGQTFAATWAEVIFQIAPTREHMRRATASMREAVAQLGRRPEDCKVLTAIMPFIGRTEQEAREIRDHINTLVHPLAGLSTLSAHANVDLSTVALDARVEELRSSGTQSLIALAAQHAKAQGLTLRELGQRYGESILVPQLCGTATQIAEQLADIFTSGDADGFVISPALLPDSFLAFVELVVPELQRLGVFRVEYAAPTPRGNLHAA